MDTVARVLTYETPARLPGAPTPTPPPPVGAAGPPQTPLGGLAAPPVAATATKITVRSPSQGHAAKASPSLLLRRVSFGNPGAAPTPLSGSQRSPHHQPPPPQQSDASGGSRPASSFRAPSSSSGDDEDDDYEVDYDYAERLRAGRPSAAAVAGRQQTRRAGEEDGSQPAPSYSVPYSSSSSTASEDARYERDEDAEVSSSAWPPPPQQQQQQQGGGGGGSGSGRRHAARRHPRPHRLVSEHPPAPLLALATTSTDAAVAKLALQQQQQQQHPAHGRRPHHHHHHHQAPPPPPPPVYQPLDPVRLELAGRARQVQRAAAAVAASDASRLHDALDAEAARLREGLGRLEREAAGREAELAAAELGALDLRAGERARALEALQREHAAASAAYSAALRRSAAAAAAAMERRKAEERAEAERQRAAAEAVAAQARAEAEAAEARRRAADAEHQHEQQVKAEAAAKVQQQAAAAAAAAAAEAAAKQQQAAPPAPAPPPPPAPPGAAKPGGAPTFPVRAGKAALERASELAASLSAAERASAALAESADPALKRERRALERRVTVLVGQVSGTQSQVSARAADLASVLLGAPEHGGARLLVCLALASRLLAQCEGQVATIPSFAFPLAAVAVQVGCRVPGFLDLLLARLQRACPMLVPRWSAYTRSCAERGLTGEDHRRAIGYKEVPWVGGDAPPPPRPGADPPSRLETSDEFTARQGGYVAFYAAVLQYDVDPRAGCPDAARLLNAGGGGGGGGVFGARPRGGGAAAAAAPAPPPPLPPAELAALRDTHGLAGAWAYAARLLNHVPASRTSAAALMAFLNAGGSAMHARYGGQFVKMLHSLYDAFLPDLAAHGDPDARAVGARLRTYLERAQYASVPEGRELPLQDESSYTRAS
jgi:hypothetical protein